MTDNSRTVLLVDDDFRVREALCNLLESVGLRVVLFESATSYLAAARPEGPSCLVLDVELPDINGLELQRVLADGDAPPIVFITGHANIPSTVQAMKAGAIEFLAKPLDEQKFLRAIEEALAVDRVARERRTELTGLRARYERLTPRERDVLPYVVAGFANKETAGSLGTSAITIGVHRGQVMRKLAANSLAELIRIADRLGIVRPTKPP